MRWIMPSFVQFPTISGQDMLAARVQNISLDQTIANQSGGRDQEDSNTGGLSGRSLSGEFNNQSQLFSSEGTTVSTHGGAASSSKLN